VGEVKIVAPRADWPKEFERIAADLRRVLDPLAVRIDHVGSTSVVGLAAKDVIDVQITVSDSDALASAAELLTEAGYFVNADARDHVVLGEREDAELWRKAFASERPGERRAHIHVRIAGRPNQIYALLFSDYLRTHPATALAYAEFKRRAAELLPEDSATYANLKDPVCDLIYYPAQAWAAETGWTAERA
jgi:GrpB-like predicted nucleotidyltransferase (UPF0157 family)